MYVSKEAEMQEHGLNPDIGSKLEAHFGTALDGGNLLKTLSLKPGERIKDLKRLRNGNMCVLLVRENSLGQRYRSTILNPLDLLNAQKT